MMSQLILILVINLLKKMTTMLEKKICVQSLDAIRREVVPLILVIKMMMRRRRKEKLQSMKTKRKLELNGRCTQTTLALQEAVNRFFAPT